MLIHIKNRKDFKYWMNYINVFTNDLANTSLIPIQNKDEYFVALMLDDLQDTIEKLDSGIVLALQAWRHRNVIIG